MAAKLPAAQLLNQVRIQSVAKAAPTVLPQDQFGKGLETAPAVAISTSAFSTLAPPAVDLSVGDEGAAVQALQQCLVQLGFLSATDMASGPGIFGPRTKAALQGFQATWGVPATGNFGPMSRAAMAKALAGEKAPPPPTYTGSSPAPGTTNTDAWIAVNAPVRGDPSNRNADTYDNVINQFAVGVNPRYTPRGGNTYCNIFAWDVTRAMGAEIPHWVDAQGRPSSVGQGRELDANDTNRWLNQHGAQSGWRKVTAAEAQALANQGHPAVASWLNPNGIGHIGVVRPGEQNANGPALAQAGAENFNHGHVYDVFPRNGTEYWVNDKGALTTQPQPQPTEPTQPNQPTQPAPSAAVPQSDLARGAVGDEVQQLQAALVQLGFMSQADMDTGPGIFGPRTEAAVKAFQAANSVPSTGYYGPLTRAALANALTPVAAPAQPQPAQPTAPSLQVPQSDLERGATGEEVRQLQAALVHLGFMSQADMDTGPGEFGPRTEAALKAFQAANGVPSTGYFGPLSRAALSNALNAVATPAQPEPAQPTAPSLQVPQSDLEKGATGEEVRQLQAALVHLGFMSQADMDTGPGEFGPRTEAALKAFQAANGVPSTGYFGPLSRAALTTALGGAAPAPVAPSEPQPEPQPAQPSFTVPQVDLEQGASGAEVLQLQANLVQLGFLGQDAMNTGPGEFGPRTAAALRAFQAAWGVPATGYFGPLTRNAMVQALSGAQAPQPVAPAIPGAEEAIAYAFNPPPNPMDPSGSWHYWCLGLVNKAYQHAGNPDGKLAAYNAIGAYRNYLNAGEIHTEGTPPRGAIVFFTWANDGHIGISLGDGNYIGTLTSGPATGVRSIYSGSYLGWAYP